jgi:hypothetical protein
MKITKLTIINAIVPNIPNKVPVLPVSVDLTDNRSKELRKVSDTNI